MFPPQQAATVNVRPGSQPNMMPPAQGMGGMPGAAAPAPGPVMPPAPRPVGPATEQLIEQTQGSKTVLWIVLAVVILIGAAVGIYFGVLKK
jgi:hypothetical protein